MEEWKNGAREGWKIGRRFVWALVLVAGSAGAQELQMSDAAASAETLNQGSGFIDVLLSGGVLGVVLWLALALLSLAGTHLIIDSFIKIRAKRIIPDALTGRVREALETKNIPQAMQWCNEEPGALSNILSAGFTSLPDGPEAAQEAIEVAAELEGEKLLQRINYLNVVGNLAPMLGLLGTVQGMIMAFATLGTEAGAAKNAMLAVNISQALYTTAAGLVVAVPALGFFAFFRNRATRIILSIEALTMDLMKKLRKDGSKA
jgi:biopolymer transport protein ExbB